MCLLHVGIFTTESSNLVTNYDYSVIKYGWELIWKFLVCIESRLYKIKYNKSNDTCELMWNKDFSFTQIEAEVRTDGN